MTEQTELFSFDSNENLFDAEIDKAAEKLEVPEVAEEPAAELSPEAIKMLSEENQPAKPSKEEEAKMLVIYDAIMFEDTYSEVLPLGKKYSVELRTRTGNEDLQISRKLDALKVNTVAAYQTSAAILSLSYAVVRLNGTDMSAMTPEERFNELTSKPSALIESLSRSLNDFDLKVRDAIDYGQENF